jgi:hypothetical protein
MTLSSELPIPQVIPNVCLLVHDLSVSARDVSYQILHAKYLLECLLQKFVMRSVNFDVVFFQGSCSF